MTTSTTITALVAAINAGDAVARAALLDLLTEQGRNKECKIVEQAESLLVDAAGRVHDAEERIYLYCDNGGVERLNASSMEEAIEAAEEFCRGGDWEEGDVVEVTIREEDARGNLCDIAFITVEIGN